MKRINLIYDGVPYAVGGVSLVDLKAEVQRIVASGSPEWLRVTCGEGRPQPVDILIQPGVGTALIEVDAANPEHPEARED